MIDLHFHVLPGVDDGPDNLADAVEMCRMAAEDGCRVVVSTPHQRHDLWENRDRALLERRLAELRAAVAGIIEVRLGAEIRVDSELIDELSAPDRRGLLPLCGGRYLLLELPRHGSAIDPVALAHELIVGGWRPILAHPELISALVANEPIVESLQQMGVLFQVTADSVLGRFGRTARQVCEAWLDAGRVDFVASDAHSPRRRRPGLAEARDAIAAGWGQDMALALTSTNPLAVIEGRPLPGRRASEPRLAVLEGGR
jgi:protein-tyrosine phosphatase